MCMCPQFASVKIGRLSKTVPVLMHLFCYINNTIQRTCSGAVYAINPQRNSWLFSSHLAQTISTTLSLITAQGDPVAFMDSRSTCTDYACYIGPFGSTLIMYMCATLLHILCLYYKQVLLYWCALLICTLVCMWCCRCSVAALSLRVMLGIFIYVYWFNFFGIWNSRVHYHHSNTWPWNPTL